MDFTDKTQISKVSRSAAGWAASPAVPIQARSPFHPIGNIVLVAPLLSLLLFAKRISYARAQAGCQYNNPCKNKDIWPSYRKLRMHFRRSVPRITDLSQRIGVPAPAAFPQLKLFKVV